MSDFAEVKEAVAALRRGGARDITVLQCTSEYPAPNEEINLRAMTTLGKALRLPVGLSDHSVGFEAAVAAVALGASVIEKHFTLDKSLPGPDHQASLSPEELTRFVASIRAAEEILGDGIKRMTPAERRNAPGIRRSVVAARALPKGTVLRREMLACKRPGTGLPPKDLGKLIGRTTRRALAEDEPIRREFVR
jgi:N-acetylneuraminate synthase/N,N'-diacetyllegionaminate synthase